MITDVDEVAGRVLRKITEQRVRAVDGSDVEVSARSVCVHGDSPGAVAMAVAVRETLAAAGVEIAPFVEQR